MLKRNRQVLCVAGMGGGVLMRLGCVLMGEGCKLAVGGWVGEQREADLDRPCAPLSIPRLTLFKHHYHYRSHFFSKKKRSLRTCVTFATSASLARTQAASNWSSTLRQTPSSQTR